MNISHIESIGLPDAYSASPDGVLVFHKDGSIYSANRNVTRLLGYSVRQLVKMHLDDLIPDRMKDTHHKYFTHWLNHPYPRSMGNGSVYGRHVNGEEIPLYISLSYADTESGVLPVAYLRYRGNTTYPQLEGTPARRETD